MKKWKIYLILFFVLVVRFILFFDRKVPYKIGDHVRITSKVTSEPVRYENVQYLKLQGFKIYLPLYPEIGYGDEVVVEGQVDSRRKSLEVRDWTFGQTKDLRLKNPILIEKKVAKGLIFRLRQKLLAIYQQSLPQPHSALVAGVTIGSKSDIPNPFWEKLKVSGTAHVVVASGMNVTLVAGFLLSFLLPVLGRRKAIAFSLVGIWLYTILAGFDAPIIRAAVMGSIAFTALGLGRLNTAWRAFFISVIVMLLVRPDWITDLGFLLSFSATASIMLFQRPTEKFVSKLKIFNKLGIIKTDLVTTIAAQILVAPVIFTTFGQFNILSPLINAAVLWTIPFITIIGMLGGVLGLLFVPLGTSVLLLSYPLTWWFVTIINLMS